MQLSLAIVLGAHAVGALPVGAKTSGPAAAAPAVEAFDFDKTLKRCAELAVKKVEKAFEGRRYGDALADLRAAVSRCTGDPEAKRAAQLAGGLAERAARLERGWNAVVARGAAAAPELLEGLLAPSEPCCAVSAAELTAVYERLYDGDEQLQALANVAFPAELDATWEGGPIDAVFLHNAYFEDAEPATNEALLSLVRDHGKGRVVLRGKIEVNGRIPNSAMQSLRAVAVLELHLPGLQGPVATATVTASGGHVDPSSGAIALAGVLGKKTPAGLRRMLLTRRYLPQAALREVVAQPTAPAPAAPGGDLVTILELQRLNDVRPEIASLATAAVVDAVGAFPGVRAITRGDVEVMLAAERQKDLAGCTEVTCMSEIAAALGSRWLLHGSVGGAGAELSVSLALVDTKSAAVDRQARSFGGPSELRRALGDAVKVLLGRRLGGESSTASR